MEGAADGTTMRRSDDDVLCDNFCVTHLEASGVRSDPLKRVVTRSVTIPERRKRKSPLKWRRSR
jgi:hypothetical protein